MSSPWARRSPPPSCSTRSRRCRRPRRRGRTRLTQRTLQSVVDTSSSRGRDLLREYAAPVDVAAVDAGSTACRCVLAEGRFLVPPVHVVGCLSELFGDRCQLRHDIQPTASRPPGGPEIELGRPLPCG